MGKKPKGPMTVDALGNAISVAELEERQGRGGGARGRQGAARGQGCCRRGRRHG
jgi:hypothetical protein